MPSPITDACAGKTAEERALIKATALVERVGKKLPYNYALNGISISVLTVEVDAHNCFSLTLTARDGTGFLPVPDYAAGEAFKFYNPPVMRRTSETEATEDPLTVAERFVYDAVVTYARNHGWNG